MANVREKTRALNKGPCPVFIKIRRLTNVMGVHKEKKKLGTLTWGREGKGGFEGIRCLGFGSI